MLLKRYALMWALIATVIALLIGYGIFVSAAHATDRTVPITCGQDIDNVVNGDPSGTATLFRLDDSCTFTASAVLKPQNNDEMDCEVPSSVERTFFGSGYTATIDPATHCHVQGSSGISAVFKPQGRFFMQGVLVTGGAMGYSGTSTGACIAEGQMTSESWLQFIEVRDCPAVGISNAHGVHHGIELSNTTTDPSALGITGSGIKGVDEFVIEYSYIHDNQGNGIWCDIHCDNQNASTFSKAEFYGNVVVNSGRAGIRWERIGATHCGTDCDANAGQGHIAANRVAGNGTDQVRGGIDIRDAQDAIVENNVIGPQTIGGLSFGHNATNLAIRATDSGRTERPDLYNIDIINNQLLSGETIIGCDLPDDVVYCANNGSGGGGTPTDTDGDGVTDDVDLCPNEAGPASNNGCPIATAGARLVGAGDIADSGSADSATANLIKNRPDASVYTAGDNAYPDGTSSDFTNKYDPTWGAFVGRTHPSPGNHDYHTSGASGYKNYFSGKAAPGFSANPTYYAYTLGNWRVYALDSNISMASGSPQYNFLQNDLQQDNHPCELAYWHHPIQSSGEHGPTATAKPIFALLDAQNADLVLNGHDHDYERFGRINSSGAASSSGVVEIVAGTGGTGLRSFTKSPTPATIVRNASTHGILDIDLNEAGWSGSFVPADGTFTDSFNGSCQ